MIDISPLGWAVLFLVFIAGYVVGLTHMGIKAMRIVDEAFDEADAELEAERR